MRVNGCFSNTRQVVIEQPEVYVISLDPIHPYCYEGNDGAIDLTMTGGVAGQMVFTAGGAGVTALHYTELNDLSATGSIEAWVYLNSFDDATLVAKGTDYSLKLLGSKFTVDVNGTYIGDAAGEGAAANPLELQRWYYVVGTWDRNSGNMNLYVNGADQGGTTQNAPLTAAPTNNSDVVIGADFGGIIREVRLWSSIKDGSIPNEKYTGNEDGDGLVAYWPLEDGSGNTSPNSSTASISGATAVSGASGLWSNQQPQPGFYEWHKDSEATIFSEDIDIIDLERGSYEVTFQDQYNCPADPGLQKSVTLVPTDEELPEITNIGNQFRDTDDTFCGYVIKSDGTDDELMPTITDDCEFTVTWKVTPEKTLVTETFFDDVGETNKIKGATLELGVNRVEVTATQYNGNIVASYFYNITVEDDDNPIAIGKNVSDINLRNDNTPMGSGIVEYDAVNFNNGSWDYCTEDQNLTFEISDDGGATWAGELSFDCGDLGTEVQIAFKAIDEAGNEGIQTGITATVDDIYPPEFTGTARNYEACVTVDDDTNAEGPYTIIPAGTLPLDANDYTDNCNVDKVEYSVDFDDEAYTDIEWTETTSHDPSDDGIYFYEGTATISFRITDSSENSAIADMYYIEILPKPAPSGGIN
jgi:hypothetical protein